MSITTMQNLSAEVATRPKRKKYARSTVVPRAPRPSRPYQRYPDRATRRGVAEALLNTPEPPCTNHRDGPCSYLAHCTTTGQVCKAFAAYANCRRFQDGERIPYRSLRSLNDAADYLAVVV